MERTRRFTIAIDLAAADRLSALARAERRGPREQAALLLEGALAQLISEGERRRAARRPRAPLPPPLDVPTEPDTR